MKSKNILPNYQVLRNIGMLLLALDPLLNWYAIPSPLGLGPTLILGFSAIVLLMGQVKVRALPSMYYLVAGYICVLWCLNHGMQLWTLLPPGGVLFFCYSLFLYAITSLFDLNALRRYMSWVVYISIPLFLIQYVLLHTTGEHICFVPNLTGQFTYEGWTYADLVSAHKYSSNPCSIFIEKSYMAYYLVTYLCIRFFASDTREKWLSPTNIVIMVTLLLLNSGSGIVGLAVLLGTKLYALYVTGNATRKVLVVFLMVPLISGTLYIFSRSEAGAALTERSTELSTEGTSGYARVMAGYAIYGSQDTYGKMFGSSREEAINNSEDSYNTRDRFYANGVQMILITLGAVGAIFWLLFYVSVFRRGDQLVRMSIIILLVLSLLEADYLNPYHLMLTVIPCALLYQTQYGKQL